MMQGRKNGVNGIAGYPQSALQMFWMGMLLVAGGAALYLSNFLL